ncbi:MAG: RNA-binding ribosome biosynthesis protein mak21 [Ramalina farinacea]|uniref:RNA-binding ribosome biosynthesis protein mak21 n=1 Tax=Ramalina farinacea TaxID=258253 RepID=A0AA43QTG2_9LECA|nr:RNA-binding ribosome biosynthesis protein mak21 [Ramalina farinacea]
MDRDAFPDFNADALQNLTNKIQTNLLQTGNPSPKPNNNAKPKKTRQDATAKAKGDQKPQVEPKKSRPPKEQIASQPAQPRSHPQVVPPKSAQQNGSKKRLRNGEIKKPALKSDVNTIKIKKPRLNGASPPSNEILRREIKALGGAEEDFELVAGVTSDSEVEGTTGLETEKGLSKGLEKVIDRLGIAEARQDDDKQDSEESEEGEPSAKDSELHNAQANGNANKIPMNDNLSRMSSTKSKKDQTPLLFEPLSEWHAAELPLIAHSTDAPALPPDTVQRLHDYAKSLLDEENQAYSTSQRSASSSQQFYSTIMSTGTLSDKIGALTLSVQESPLHNIKALESLLGLARKRSRAQAVEVLGALKDLFAAGNLLPSDRKLRTFAGQPALHAAFESKHEQWTADKPLPRPLKKAHLIVWAFEDWLKSLFFQVLTIIETWCNDEVVFARGKAVDYVYSLLKEKPEQEANLLRLLVNKLGDSEKKVASKTSFNILQLETTHPSMKPIIVSAIESDLLFRPGQSFHAQYYAIITLNQTVLSSREESIARQLLNIYFALFLKLLEKPKTLKTEDELPQKAAKVTINRKGEIQGGGGAGGKKAAQKAAEKKKSTTAVEDLQEKMLSAVLTGVNRAIPFISANDESFEKHIDTLFRVTHSSNFNTSIQALMLIQQLQGSHQTTADRFYRTLYESLLDSRLLTSSKQVLYLNLLYRSLRADLDTKRIKAFIKRLLQIISMHQPPFVCGVLYLIRELETTLPSLSSFIHQPEEKLDDEEEAFRDVPEDSPASSPPPSNPSNHTGTNSSNIPQTFYDGRKRDPLHANAQSSTCWDMHPLLTHYHPSVSLFTGRLLSHSAMPPKPDLSLNTLIHFLDRFVYKNPKSSSSSSGGTTRGASLMQPLLATGGSRTDGGVLVTGGGAGRRDTGPVNSASFWKRNKEEIGADEVFFHRYFSALGMGKEKRAEKKKRKEEKKKARSGGGEDDSEAEEEEEEGEIWKALVGSKPDIEGDDEDENDGFDDEDVDDGFSDLDDDDGIDHEDATPANTTQPKDDDDDDDAAFPPFADDDAASGSEMDALLDSDEEIDLDAAFAAENTPSLTHDDQRKKRKAPPNAGREDDAKPKKGGSHREKRMKLRNLPTFAGVEEYAQLLGD